MRTHRWPYGPCLFKNKAEHISPNFLQLIMTLKNFRSVRRSAGHAFVENGKIDDFDRENSSFSAFKKNGLHRDHPTIRRTDGRTDTTSYRDARTHLKIGSFALNFLLTGGG